MGIRGLELFKEYFTEYNNQFIIIGGTASYLILEKEGASFRVTKDFDIVLVIEALTKKFVESFWEFIKQGEYTYQKQNGKTNFYRFTKPKNIEFPFMLEILSRKAEVLGEIPDGNITPIIVDDSIVSLSAILLNKTYYGFIMNNTIFHEGINLVSPLCLIGLKARAYLDLSERKVNGEVIKSNDIKKHKNDIFRLAQVLNKESKIEVPKLVREDIRKFIADISNQDIVMRDIGVVGTKDQYLIQLNKIFGI